MQMGSTSMVHHDLKLGLRRLGKLSLAISMRRGLRSAEVRMSGQQGLRSGQRSSWQACSSTTNSINLQADSMH